MKISVSPFILFLVLVLAMACVVVRAEAAPWQEPYVYDLRDHVQPAECTRRGCNLTPAIERSTALCEVELASVGKSNRQYTGCLFLVPAGDHTLTKTIRSCRAHTYAGRGGVHRRALSTLTATQTMFIAEGWGACNDGTSSGAITVRDLGLQFPSGPHTKPIIAIQAAAKIHLANLHIIYPDIGVLISADVTRTPKSNANSSRLINVAVEYTRHAGMLFRGGDSNAHAVAMPNVSTSCMAKDTPEGQALEALYGPCGGYVDRSFLGNFAAMGHFAAAEGYPDILISGASNHGTVHGGYVEGQTPPQLLAPHSQWVGGIGPMPTGPGLRLDGYTANSLAVRNDLDPANSVTLQMGRATNNKGTYYGLAHGANGWSLRMKWRPDILGGSYLEDIGNLGAGRVRTLIGTKNAPGGLPLGGVLLHNIYTQ